jgi:hypothetical protein
MQKLIETYSKMENVIPAAIQLIFNGNPISENDTPRSAGLASDDILEVCRVPGFDSPRKSSPDKHEAIIKHEPGTFFFKNMKTELKNYVKKLDLIV